MRRKKVCVKKKLPKLERERNAAIKRYVIGQRKIITKKGNQRREKVVSGRHFQKKPPLTSISLRQTIDFPGRKFGGDVRRKLERGRFRRVHAVHYKLE